MSPNPGYALRALASANGFVVFAFAGQAASVSLGGGCTLFVDDTQLLALHLVQADAGGVASWAVPIPAGLAPTDLAAQAFEVVTGGPVFGLLTASNGLRIRGAASGCP